jgi:hypothetical protein
MGFLSKLFSRNRPSERLRKISRRLDVSSNLGMMAQDTMAGLKSGTPSDRSQAEEDLLLRSCAEISINS